MLPTGWVGYAPLSGSAACRSTFFILTGPRFAPAGPWLTGSSFLLGWYWVEALAGGYLLTLAWYRWQARWAGTALPGRAFRIAGMVLTVAGLALPLLAAALADRWQPACWPSRGRRARSSSWSSPSGCGSSLARSGAGPWP